MEDAEIGEEREQQNIQHTSKKIMEDTETAKKKSRIQKLKRKRLSMKGAETREKWLYNINEYNKNKFAIQTI